MPREPLALAAGSRSLTGVAQIQILVGVYAEFFSPHYPSRAAGVVKELLHRRASRCSCTRVLVHDGHTISRVERTTAHGALALAVSRGRASGCRGAHIRTPASPKHNGAPRHTFHDMAVVLDQAGHQHLVGKTAVEFVLPPSGDVIRIADAEDSALRDRTWVATGRDGSIVRIPIASKTVKRGCTRPPPIRGCRFEGRDAVGGRLAAVMGRDAVFTDEMARDRAAASDWPELGLLATASLLDERAPARKAAARW